MNLLAIVGQPGSGKDTAADYIANRYGFSHISSGDVLREYITNNNMGNLERANLQRVVTKLRAEYGNGVLVDLILREMDQNSKIVVSGLRHPEEVGLVSKAGGALISIVSSAKRRYKRSIERNRTGDNISFAEFKRLEEVENQGGSWDIGEVIRMADYSIVNDGGYEDLLANLDGLMQQLGISKH